MSVSNLVVPVVLWGRNPPTHCISAILMTQDEKNIITGCNDGQIVVWDVTEDWKVRVVGLTHSIPNLSRRLPRPTFSQKPNILPKVWKGNH
jgi:hypothetical protein